MSITANKSFVQETNASPTLADLAIHREEESARSRHSRQFVRF